MKRKQHVLPDPAPDTVLKVRAFPQMGPRSRRVCATSASAEWYRGYSTVCGTRTAPLEGKPELRESLRDVLRIIPAVIHTAVRLSIVSSQRFSVIGRVRNNVGEILERLMKYSERVNTRAFMKALRKYQYRSQIWTVQSNLLDTTWAHLPPVTKFKCTF